MTGVDAQVVATELVKMPVLQNQHDQEGGRMEKMALRLFLKSLRDANLNKAAKVWPEMLSFFLKATPCRLHSSREGLQFST